MERKIEMYFEYEDDGLIIVYLTDESENNITKQVKEYNIDIYNKKLTLEENQVDFYNQMLNDFNAEYDDDLADIIDKIVKKII